MVTTHTNIFTPPKKTIQLFLLSLKNVEFARALLTANAWQFLILINSSCFLRFLPESWYLCRKWIGSIRSNRSFFKKFETTLKKEKWIGFREIVDLLLRLRQQWQYAIAITTLLLLSREQRWRKRQNSKIIRKIK